MSSIVDAIMTVHYACPKVADLLTKPIDPNDPRKQAFAPINTASAGGNKQLTADIYAAAFNYLSPSHILNWLFQLPWCHIDNVSLTAAHEDGAAFTMVRSQGKFVMVETYIVDEHGTCDVRVFGP